MIQWFFTQVLKIIRWKIVGTIPEEPKFLIIGAPHTSNWDFPLVISAKFSLNLKTKYMGKAELFRFPFGWFFRMLGGYPVYRDENRNMVDSIIEIFNQKTHFSIGLAPEGTRKYVGKFKTGFYHIAHKAKIPIVMIGLDYEHKSLIIHPKPFWTTGNIDADMPKIMEFFRPIKGRYPEKGMMKAG